MRRGGIGSSQGVELSLAAAVPNPGQSSDGDESRRWRGNETEARFERQDQWRREYGEDAGGVRATRTEARNQKWRKGPEQQAANIIDLGGHEHAIGECEQVRRSRQRQEGYWWEPDHWRTRRCHYEDEEELEGIAGGGCARGVGRCTTTWSWTRLALDALAADVHAPYQSPFSASRRRG